MPPTLRQKTPLHTLISEGVLWTPVSEELASAGPCAEGGHIGSEGTNPLLLPTHIEALDEELGGGLQKNAIHTFSGVPLDGMPATPLLFCSYLAVQTHQQEGRKKPIVWLGEERLWPTPWVLQQLADNLLVGDLSPASCLFVETKNDKELAWALKATLSSRSVSAVVAPTPRLRFRETQSLSVLARSGGCTAFLYAERFEQRPSGYYSHWLVEPTTLSSSSPSFSLILKKTKGKQPRLTRWDIVFTEGRFWTHDAVSTLAAVPVAVPEQSLDRTGISRYG